MAIEITKKMSLKGEHAQKRLFNFLKLAKVHYRGNFSAMVNDVLSKHFNLDPETGESLPGKNKGCCCEAKK